MADKTYTYIAPDHERRLTLTAPAGLVPPLLIMMDDSGEPVIFWYNPAGLPDG
jgi:hypothetical protein